MMAKKKNNPIQVQFNEQGMRTFDNSIDAVAYFSQPENGGHKFQTIYALFNSTFLIVVGSASINVSGWKSKVFSTKVERVFKNKGHKENFDVIFAKWKSKFGVETPQIVEETKPDEPIVDELTTPNVD
jgi:hypothetical protein